MFFLVPILVKVVAPIIINELTKSNSSSYSSGESQATKNAKALHKMHQQQMQQQQAKQQFQKQSFMPPPMNFNNFGGF